MTTELPEDLGDPNAAEPLALRLDAGLGVKAPERAAVGMQQRLHERLATMPNRMGSVTEMAALLRTSRLAVYSAARALHRRGLAVQWLYAGDGEGCQMVAYREPPNAEITGPRVGHRSDE